MIEAWQVEVVTLTLDLGQRDELDAVRERALACGAIRAHVLDERESFARDYLLPALKAGAASEDGHPLGRVLTRPLIARQLVDVAKMEGVAEVAHACWYHYDDRVRLERAIRDAGPDMLIRAPLVEASLSDNEMLTFADAHDLPIGRIGSQVDANLWERCKCEGAPSHAAEPNIAASGGAEIHHQQTSSAARGPASSGAQQSAAARGSDPQVAAYGAPSHAAGSRVAASHGAGSSQQSTAGAPRGSESRSVPSPVAGLNSAFGAGAELHGQARTPDVPAVVSIEFSAGTPVGLNGVTMPLLEIISTLETLASAHGVGRTSQLAAAWGAGGAVVRQCDAPAATLLDVALRQFERLVLPADAWRDVQALAALYRDIVFRGAWAAASRRGCDAFVNAIHAPMTGAVRLRLFKGSVSVIDCASASAGEFVDAVR